MVVFFVLIIFFGCLYLNKNSKINPKLAALERCKASGLLGSRHSHAASITVVVWFSDLCRHPVPPPKHVLKWNWMDLVVCFLYFLRRSLDVRYKLDLSEIFLPLEVDD